MSLKSVYMTSDTKDLAYSKKDVSAIVDACHVHDVLVEALEDAALTLRQLFVPCPANLPAKLSSSERCVRQAISAAKGES